MTCCLDNILNYIKWWNIFWSKFKHHDVPTAHFRKQSLVIKYIVLVGTKHLRKCTPMQINMIFNMIFQSYVHTMSSTYYSFNCHRCRFLILLWKHSDIIPLIRQPEINGLELFLFTGYRTVFQAFITWIFSCIYSCIFLNY